MSITTEGFRILSVCRGGGYKYCRTEPAHPRQNANGLYPLHRVLMENKIGRLLEHGEVVHHSDGDKENNTPENLEIMTVRNHARHHARKNIVARVTVKCVCGKEFKRRPRNHAWHAQHNRSGKVFCSLSCAGKFARIA